MNSNPPLFCRYDFDKCLGTDLSDISFEERDQCVTSTLSFFFSNKIINLGFAAYLNKKYRSLHGKCEGSQMLVDTQDPYEITKKEGLVFIFHGSPFASNNDNY